MTAKPTRMHVVLFAAQSLDGRITRRTQAGDAFTSEADKAHFRQAIRACDACVMGGRTYAQSKDRLRPDILPGLRRVVWTRRPEAYLAASVPGILEFTNESPTETVRRLRTDGRRRCAVLGGGQVNAAWLRAGLVDEVCVTVEPWIFGGGVPLAGDGGDQEPASASSPPEARLTLLEAKTLAPGGPVLLRYAVQK